MPANILQELKSDDCRSVGNVAGIVQPSESRIALVSALEALYDITHAMPELRNESEQTMRQMDNEAAPSVQQVSEN